MCLKKAMRRIGMNRCEELNTHQEPGKQEVLMSQHSEKTQ